jgi:hypothetical protein
MMRAVALADPAVQAKVSDRFVPLKVTILPGTKEFPLDWPAAAGWRNSYRLMGGEGNEGFTGCSVVGPDLQIEYGNTGSAFVWELFESTAYDAGRFAAMLYRAHERWSEEETIRKEAVLPGMRDRRIERHRRQVSRAVANEGRLRLPPRGFTVEGAKELFRLSGDLKDRS